MGRLEKALILGAAGLLAYQLIARRRKSIDLSQYYQGKVAVVTGGASGIGLAIVYELHRLGAHVLAVDRNELTLEKLKAELPEVATLAIDLIEEDAPQRVLNEALAQFGGLDLLFNNAGILFAGPFLEINKANIELLVAVNFTMQIRMTHTILPYLLSCGQGVIAYTGSLSAHVYAPMHSIYTGTKGGLHNFVAALRRELPVDGRVQLTIIHPNVTRTNLADANLFDRAEKVAGLKLETPEEVARTLLTGIARGEREIFVRTSDHFYKWAERLLPSYLDSGFRRFAEVDAHNKEAVRLAE
ncbi:MAG: SDR family oxidoreductase [Acidobacteriota bacterium]